MNAIRTIHVVPCVKHLRGKANNEPISFGLVVYINEMTPISFGLVVYINEMTKSLYIYSYCSKRANPTELIKDSAKYIYLKFLIF